MFIKYTLYENFFSAQNLSCNFFTLSINAHAFKDYEVECADNSQATFLKEDINAYNFGLKIQEAFRARDLNKIIQLIGTDELD